MRGRVYDAAMDRFFEFLTATITIFGFSFHNWMLLVVVVVFIWLTALIPGLKI